MPLLPPTAWLHICMLTLLATLWTLVHGITNDEIFVLKQDTRHLFYHGFDNYMQLAFPEDELKPISCEPQTRNKENPADIGLNDVLGNYSLTLIDSLSTLAILASDQDVRDGRDPLGDFQDGVKSLVDLYGDGSTDEDGRVACGNRTCGFDLDSKVQVFETNIRGVGGLLSAHLFAMGDLPIRGYNPVPTAGRDGIPIIIWRSGFVYDGQLLRLAYDLASRLLPAFNTTTGLPYPRVNLRHGIPFYQDAEDGFCRLDGTSTDPREITETCTAGAGSLILEFATLSRLSGDDRFERLAKRAFWAVWERRSGIGLVGNGIDAESGQWTLPPLAGIGAGIDSFFEYGLKSSILLSGLPQDDEGSPEALLEVWQQAHAAVKRHVYRPPHTEKHPFYGQADLVTGAPRYTWIDNLSAYYPGLLTLAGELDEAIESHLLYAALWTRYSALPERWHAVNAWIDPNFKHWAGRPEFIESTWYLYRATQDPWYLHVGEMALRDIRRRCWARCGWADLGDVVSGEQRDRMESFFLGETAKYLFLLFDPNHPLNHLDDAMVFTTEGHPLVIPNDIRLAERMFSDEHAPVRASKQANAAISKATCPASLPPLPLSYSNTADRADLFHAGAMAQLHLVPISTTRSSPILQNSNHGPAISYSDVRSPTNYTWFPWTLSHQLVPQMGMSASIRSPVISTLSFPNLNVNAPDGSPHAPEIIPLGALQKTTDGILINSFSNLRLNMVQQPRSFLVPDDAGFLSEVNVGYEYRVHGIGNWALGRDEKVWIGENAVKGLRLESMSEDSALRRVKDLEWIDLVIDAPTVPSRNLMEPSLLGAINDTMDDIWDELSNLISGLFNNDEANGNKDTSDKAAAAQAAQVPALARTVIPAILPTGPGAAPLPQSVDAQDTTSQPMTGLIYRNVLYLDDTLCRHRLPQSMARNYHILVIKRGGCSFSRKLANVASFAPSNDALQLVVMISMPEADHDGSGKQGQPGSQMDLIRPLLDEVQKTPHGFERRNGIAMAMVDGNEGAVAALKRVATAFGSFDEKGKLVEKKPGRRTAGGAIGAGIGVKRRYWFESMGMPIGNLLMA